MVSPKERRSTTAEVGAQPAPTLLAQVFTRARSACRVLLVLLLKTRRLPCDKKSDWEPWPF